MSEGLLKTLLGGGRPRRPPVWFMRQAGRYHSHYQALRKQHSFVDLCKKPELACEVTLGPIRDFGFDAAILFSDLLFPLEAMGMPLTYEPGPQLGWHLQSIQDVAKLQSGEKLAQQMGFQAEAIKKIRPRLPVEAGLLGFVGGPLTLYCYAVEGGHAGALASARKGMDDGRYDGFIEKLIPILTANMVLQAEAGIDSIAVFDTCAGEFEPGLYARRIVPALAEVFKRFKKLCPTMPITYYSKGTGHEHWSALTDLPITCLGVDWHHDLGEVLERWSERWVIQGNFDPSGLLASQEDFEKDLAQYLATIRRLPARLQERWVCGLGHGVLPATPERAVSKFVSSVHQIWGQP